MLQTKSHQIDGLAYDVTQLDPMTGLDVMTTVMRVLGPAFSADDPMSAFAKNLNGADLKTLCNIFAKTTMVQGPGGPDSRIPLAGVMTTHFAGKYGSLFKWLWACVDTNFETFFAELGVTAEVREKLLKGLTAEVLGKSPTSQVASSGASSLPASGA